MANYAEQRMKKILSCSPAIIYTGKLGEPFNLTFITENFPLRFGYQTAECLDNPAFWREKIHPDDLVCVFADYAALGTTKNHVHEYRFRASDGRYCWILDELCLNYDAAGQPVEVVGSWLDITDRKETEFALKKSATLFRDFFQINPVPTIISSPSGTIHMVNPAFAKGPGFTQEEVEGRTVQEFGFWRKPEDRQRMVASVEEHGYIDNLESTFYGKGNRPMTCLISSRLVEYEGETRILSTVLDITEQRKAEESLRKLDQAKSDFISAAAHELRTPLVAIVGYCELLENSGGPVLAEQQKADYLEIIQSNAETLNLLVDDLLDVGRIQVGKALGVHLKENNLSEIIENAVKSLSVKQPRHSITVTFCDPLPAFIPVDRGRITQVFNNLLNNAIKYTPAGGTITIETRTRDEFVSVTVSDPGMGMTRDQVEHVFDRFYRADGSHAKASGLGLGMSIVKQIVTDHGGDIHVSSQPGRGTVVTFTLPIK